MVERKMFMGSSLAASAGFLAFAAAGDLTAFLAALAVASAFALASEDMYSVRRRKLCTEALNTGFPSSERGRKRLLSCGWTGGVANDA